MPDLRAVEYPIDCETTLDKLEYLYSRQEALRLYHNEMGAIMVKWRDAGISKVEYDMLAKSIKAFMPFKERITLEEFTQLWIGDPPNTGAFYGGYFAEQNNSVSDEVVERRGEYMLEIKTSMKTSVRWTHNVENK